MKHAEYRRDRAGALRVPNAAAMHAEARRYRKIRIRRSASATGIAMRVAPASGALLRWPPLAQLQSLGQAAVAQQQPLRLAAVPLQQPQHLPARTLLCALSRLPLSSAEHRVSNSAACSSAAVTGSTIPGAIACPPSTARTAGCVTTTTCCWSTSTAARWSTSFTTSSGKVFRRPVSRVVWTCARAPPSDWRGLFRWPRTESRFVRPSRRAASGRSRRCGRRKCA